MSKYLIKKNGKGEWRWTFLARNGEKIAQASEGYKTKASCEKSVALMQASAGAPVEYAEPKEKASAKEKPAKPPKAKDAAKKSAKKVVKAMKSAAEAMKPAKKSAKAKA